jgi:hypothetical protein
VFPIRAELGLDGDLDMLFAGLEAGLDGASLQILVNNAGVLDFTPSRASCCAPSANVRSGIWPVGSAKARRRERAAAQSPFSARGARSRSLRKAPGPKARLLTERRSDRVSARAPYG